MSLSDAEIYLEQGIKCAQKGDYNQAISYYNKAIETDSSNPYSYYNKALAYLRTGCKNEAATFFQYFIQQINKPGLKEISRIGFALKVITDVRGVDSNVLNQLKQFQIRYRTGFYNTPGGFDTTDIKEYIICIFQVAFLGTTEAKTALISVKNDRTYADISVAVDEAIELAAKNLEELL
jgi:tetratricopeptide (TPR) repeat protein